MPDTLQDLFLSGRHDLTHFDAMLLDTRRLMLGLNVANQSTLPSPSLIIKLFHHLYIYHLLSTSTPVSLFILPTPFLPPRYVFFNPTAAVVLPTGLASLSSCDDLEAIFFSTRRHLGQARIRSSMRLRISSGRTPKPL